MSNKTLTRADLDRAIYSKSLINPAVEALKKITLQACNDDQGSFKEIQAFCVWVESFVKSADETICQAEADYDNRPRDLINTASIRLSEIPGLIFREQKTAQFAVEAYQLQIEELTKKGLDTEQCAKIINDPQVVLDLSDSVVDALNAEAEQLRNYLADAPRFDVSLLAGTGIQISTTI